MTVDGLTILTLMAAAFLVGALTGVALCIRRFR